MTWSIERELTAHAAAVANARRVHANISAYCAEQRRLSQIEMARIGERSAGDGFSEGGDGRSDGQGDTMNNTEIANDPSATPRERAIAVARLRRGIGYTEEGACEAALRAEPTVKLSRDQLKALAFGAVLHGFGEKVSDVTHPPLIGDLERFANRFED